MPIDVTLVADAEPDASLAQALSDASGAVFASPAGRTWVRLHRLPAQHYAENGATLLSSDLPVFVTVRKAVLSDARTLSDEALRLTRTIAAVLRCDPARVHVEYLPPVRGRMFFGGAPLAGALPCRWTLPAGCLR